MSSVIVQPGQTLDDIAVQHLGDQEAVFELAEINDMNITDLPTPGSSLKLPEVAQARVVSFYKSGGYFPAAGINEGELEEGIEFWRIELEFEVQ